MANKDRSFHEAPEKPGGEGWLYSEQHQKLCHFKLSMATVHAQWSSPHLQLDPATLTRPDDPAAVAAAQRN